MDATINTRLMDKVFGRYGTQKNKEDRKYLFASRMFNDFWEEVILNVLEGNVVKWSRDKEVTMYIGVDHTLDDIDNTGKPSKRWKKHINIHTNGKKYGLIIDGVSKKYHYKLSKQYRRELAFRLKAGQQYPDSI